MVAQPDRIPAINFQGTILTSKDYVSGSVVGYGSFPCSWNGGRPFTVDAQDIRVCPGMDDTLLNRIDKILEDKD